MDYYNRLNANALDPDFPTIFELLSAQELQGLIRPSLRYLIVHYAQRNPNYLLKLANRFDEIYLAIFGLLEYYHLRYWNSSFTEKFYGLKRTRLLTFNAVNTRNALPNSIEAQRRLTRGQIIFCLLGLVGYPYVKEKLEARYEVLKGRYAFRERTTPQNAKEKIQQTLDELVLKWFPRLTFIENITSLFFFVGYLFHKTQFSSLSDYIGRYKYSRISPYDHQRNNPDMSATGWARFLPSNIAKAFLGAFNYTLPTALFILKFLEWWNSSEFAKKLNKTAPLFPPPARDILGLKTCPICDKRPENPSALETGVVCCYKCIYVHIQTADKEKPPFCPVTKRPLLLTTWNTELKEWMPAGIRRLMI